MKTYDHQWVSCRSQDEISHQLKTYGEEGYALVSVCYASDPDQWDMFFTREIAKPSEVPMTARRALETFPKDPLYTDPLPDPNTCG